MLSQKGIGESWEDIWLEIVLKYENTSENPSLISHGTLLNISKPKTTSALPRRAIETLW